MAVTTDTLLVMLLMAVPAGWCQTNNKPVQTSSYYMDSNADCNGPVRQIYGQSVTVYGHGAIQQQLSPQSCTITLRSTPNFGHSSLRIQVVAATIRDCDISLTIYDGETDQSKLNGYDCRKEPKPNERDVITSGDTVSFVLTRRDTLNSLYNIEIYVQPLVSGNEPGFENDYGDQWGFYRKKLENDAVIGIVGAIFLITVILVLLGIFLCYRRYRGLNKPWQQHQMSTFRTETSVYETKSKMSDNSSGIWASNMSRSQAQPPSRRRIEPSRHMARPSEDIDSVFDGEETPPKKQLMERDRRERERERERERQRGHRRDYATQNSSFVEADDDHPQCGVPPSSPPLPTSMLSAPTSSRTLTQSQDVNSSMTPALTITWADTFVERIIEPRVRPSRVYKPPPYDEAIDSDTDKSELEGEEEEEEDDVDHRETSEEEASEQPSSEEEEEDEEEEPAGATATHPRQQPGVVPPHQQRMMPPPTGAYPGYPMHPMGYMGGYPAAPPGQFVPIVAAPPPPPAQPYPPTHPPPRYPGERLRPTDPPIYSYLVQRGYTPLDVAGRNSPASQANTSQASMDDSDKNILASGVEYMRR